VIGFVCVCVCAFLVDRSDDHNSIIIPIGWTLSSKISFLAFFCRPIKCERIPDLKSVRVLPLLPLLCVFNSIITTFFKSSLNIYDDEVLVGVVVVTIHVFVTLPNAFAETVVDDVEKILAST